MSFKKRKWPKVLEPVSTNDLPKTASSIPGRYKATEVFFDPDNNKYFLGILEPTLVNATVEDVTHISGTEDYARPDNMSYRYYGTPVFYWYILFLAGINDPFEGIVPGKRFVFPPITSLLGAGVRG